MGHKKAPHLAFFVFYFFILVSLKSQSQIYMPLEFQAVYDEGSRSLDGSPGPNYWQNHSDYNIEASINPPQRILTGSEDITYYNESPDILDRIVFRLYQNINRPGNSRDFVFDEKFFTKGIELKTLSINGKDYDLKDTIIDYTATNMIVRGLKISPGKHVDIKISWDVEIPSGNFVRMGAYDSTAFFIAYWYPQVAVYDDIYGWDMIEYTGGTEFYNDFNNYKVSITVPNNTGIWATGELENASEIYSPLVYSRYTKARESGVLENIISNTDYPGNNVLYNNSGKTNTWKFRAKEVPDFTFGLSNHYLWDGKNISDGTKNVFVSAVYNSSSTQFHEVCEVAAKTVEMLSTQLPGVPFPYPKITVFDGEDGMESPMMVNMGTEDRRIWMVHTTVHEVTHTYFPFYMGINERRYAWMDEGWAQMLSEYIQLAIDTTIDFRARNVKRYLDLAGNFDEVPMMYPSYEITRRAYGYASYFRPAAAYNILRETLDNYDSGLFRHALQEYMSRWHGKHPSPYDFFYTFEDVSGQNLAWLWEPWFFEHGYPDIGIDTVFVEGTNLKILVDKPGDLPIPVFIGIHTLDGSVMNIYKTADIWKGDDNEVWLEKELNGKTVKTVTLGNKYIPDSDSTNNVWIMK